MRSILLLICVLMFAPSHAKEIKIIKSNDYNNSLKAKAITPIDQSIKIKKRIRNIYPLPPYNKPTLNGNFSQQLAYKHGQKKIKLNSDGQ